MIDLRKYKILIAVAVLVFIGIVYYCTVTKVSPSNFPVGKTFTINENESLRTISSRLEDEHIITSALLFRVWVSFINKDRHVQLGVYEFPRELALGDVVKKVALTGPDHPLLQITIPEGSTTKEVIDNIVDKVPNLSRDTLSATIIASNANGRLFPSTYFLLPSVTEQKVIETMLNTFDVSYKKRFANETISTLLGNQAGVIILASLLEGEAKTLQDMKMVSGILLKRLTIGMPLQVDVAKETYKTKGLPKQAINNPGLNALEATFYPTSSPYLYYITGNDGTMYYAKTFDEHKANIRKHLR